MSTKVRDENLNIEIQLVKTLRKIRVDANLRQADLSKLLGRPQSFVSKYESGSQQLNILEIRQICLVTGITLRKFVDLLESSLQNGVNDET